MSSSKPTIGFKYFLGMHLVVCHGPVDEVEEIWAGERLAWAPTPGNPATKLTFSRLFFIDKPNLFGGKKKEGGVEGFVNIMMGEETQTPNDYLASVGLTTLPAFRGVLSFVLRQVYITAMTPYIKPWWFLVRRIPAQDWYPEKAEINMGANGIHIIYEAWTNPDWGMGYPSATIDDTNWREAADIIFDQNLSLSFVYAQESTIEDFIYQVLSHLNGVMYTDYRTGLQRIKILTDDYDPINDTFVELDESNIISLESYSRPGYGELTNEITIKYRRQGDTEDSSITVQDLAVINAQTGITSQTIHYPGIDTDENAALIAERDLKQHSTPLARISLIVNRAGFELTQGDVFKFSWSDLGINGMFCRVMGIDFGNLDDLTIRIEAVEDIFGLGSTSYIAPQETLWENPYVDPVDPDEFVLTEAPYYFIAQELGEEATEDLDQTASYAMSTAAKPTTGANTGHALYSGEDPDSWTATEFEEVDLASNTALLLNTISLNETDTSFVYHSTSKNPTIVTDNSFLFVGNEFIFVESVDHGTQTVTIKRGVLDTIPETHIAFSKFYLFSDNFYCFDPEQRVIGETHYYWLKGWSLLGFDTPSQDSTDSLVIGARQGRPYPPANVMFDGVSYPTESRGDFTIQWSGRNKTLSTAPNSAVGWFEGPQMPQSGTTYTIQIFDDTGPSPVFLTEFVEQTVDNETGLGSFKFTPGDNAKEAYAVRIFSVFNGYRSLFEPEFSFDVFGWGFDYGNRWGGVENGVYLRPGSIIPPSGNRIPLPDPLWLDEWYSITQDNGENQALTTTRFTWNGGVNGSDWQVINITENTGVRSIDEYGNNFRQYSAGTTTDLFFIQQGNGNWQEIDDIGLPNSPEFTYIPEFSHFVVVDGNSSVSGGRYVATTTDFVTFNEAAVGDNTLSTIMKAGKIFYNGTDYIASGQHLLSTVNNRRFVVAKSNGTDLNDWTLNPVDTPAFVFNPIYFNGKWYIWDLISPGQLDSQSTVYESTDLYDWTALTPTFSNGDTAFEGILFAFVLDGKVQFQGDRCTYTTTNFISVTVTNMRYNLRNDLEAFINPVRGKSILYDTRSNGPSQLLVRTSTAQDLGGKIVGLPDLAANPPSLNLRYPITAPYSNFVGMISRNNNTTNGIFNGGFSISGIDAEGFLGHFSGKKFYEVKFSGSATKPAFEIGLVRYFGTESQSEIFLMMTSSGGIKTPTKSSFPVNVTTEFLAGDVLSVGINFTDSEITFYRNGDLVFTFTDTEQVQWTWFPYLFSTAANSIATLNVGQETFEHPIAGFTQWWS